MRRMTRDESKDGLPRDQVIWFTDWQGLRRIEALEHFHVMLFRAPKEFLATITGRDQLGVGQAGCVKQRHSLDFL